MEKSVPKLFINPLNKFLLFGNLQILFMKRLLLLVVLAFYCASTTAQEVRTIQGSQVMAITALRVANLPELLPRDKPKGGLGTGKGGNRGGKEETPPKKEEPKKDPAKESLEIKPRVISAASR